MLAPIDFPSVLSKQFNNLNHQCLTRTRAPPTHPQSTLRLCLLLHHHHHPSLLHLIRPPPQQFGTAVTYMCGLRRYNRMGSRIGESHARDARREPTALEHTRWLVQTSPLGHHPLGLVDDSAGRKRFPKLQRVAPRTPGTNCTGGSRCVRCVAFASERL